MKSNLQLFGEAVKSAGTALLLGVGGVFVVAVAALYTAGKRIYNFKEDRSEFPTYSLQSVSIYAVPKGTRKGKLEIELVNMNNGEQLDKWEL